jgi:NAD(P)-dependent dehydrogenase (short-subunit alcohol dehydrogenase family)
LLASLFKNLARAGAEVVLAGRNEDKGREAAKRIRQQAPAAKALFEKIDLGSLASVADFSSADARGQAAHRPSDQQCRSVTPPERKTTTDGFESQFGTNHLSHFALTLQLLPLLRRGPQPRGLSP